MTPAEQMVADEWRVFDVLVDHRDWVASLPPDAVARRMHGRGLDVAYVSAAARMPRRAARRVLERLAARGAITAARLPGPRSTIVYNVAATIDG